MIKSHLEQQNFHLCRICKKKNQEQMRDISPQLQTGLQALLQQSMEQMFNRMVPPKKAPPPQPASTAPHIVSITLVSALLPAAKSEEPMGLSSISTTPELKKGVSGVNDTQQSLLASPQPGLKWKTFSESLWDYPQVRAPLKRKKSLECLNPSGEGKDSMCSIPTGGEKDSLYANPSGEGKDSLCTVPTGEGKDSLCTVPSGEGKDSLCTVPSGEGKDSLCTVFKCIYPWK